MVGRVQAPSVEVGRDGYAPPQAPPFPGPLAPARAAAARAAPLGRDRPGPGRLRGVLRLRLLPRLGGRPGGRGDGRRIPLPLRWPRLPHAGRAVRGGRPDGGPPDDGAGPPVQDRRRVPRRRAPARPGRRLARPRPGRHAARRLPRRRLPAPSRGADRRGAVLDLEHALLGGGRAHPVRLPAAGRAPAGHGRFDRRPDDGHPGRRHKHDRASAGRHALALRRRHRAAPARPAAGRPDPRRARSRRAARAGGLRAGGAGHARGGARAGRRGALSGSVRR